MASVPELCRRFNTRAKCIRFLERLRWPNGPECPKCGSRKVYPVKKRLKHQCPKCRYQFSVTAGTILHRTHLPLQKWLVAALLIANAKKGISAKQLQRDLDVTYKTAWYLAHRLRRAMRDCKFIRRMTGIIEVDETYVGGKAKDGTHARGASGKVVCGGALQRGGWVTAKVLRNASAAEVCKPILEVADPDRVDMVCADEWSGYTQLRREFNLQRVRHGKKEYARGPVHVNGLENFWSIFKRGVVGSFHKLRSEVHAILP